MIRFLFLKELSGYRCVINLKDTKLQEDKNDAHCWSGRESHALIQIVLKGQDEEAFKDYAFSSCGLNKIVFCVISSSELI